MQPRELAIRRTLGIPDTATRTLILEPSAHLDWDWVDTFEQYYEGNGPSDHQAVSLTFQQAIQLVTTYQGQSTPYPYTICEMSYLQRFLTEFPDQASVLNGFGSLLQIASGGFVSADNLLSHPEAFIRNYLFGQNWMTNAIGPHATPTLWIPDDFGHDSQLPALAAAMGFTGAGFWRIPGDPKSPPCCKTVKPAPDSPCAVLRAKGVDFTWTASDGSSLQAHWLYGSYCQGNTLGTPPTASGLEQLVDAPPVTASTYFYVPIDCDFQAPLSGDLITVVNDWNAQHQSAGDTYVCLSSFNHFMDLVRESGVVLPSFPMTMNPYYMGAYGSRMILKSAHYQAARALVFAEALAVLLGALADAQGNFETAASQADAGIATAWADLIPSTHHDYITGTAADTVYQQEQLPLVTKALDEANDVLTTLQTTIAGAVGVASGASAAAIVFNAAPVSNPSALAELSALPSPLPSGNAATPAAPAWAPVQVSADQTLLFLADVPALGYAATYFSDQTPYKTNLSYTTQDGGFTLQNVEITAVIDATGTLTSLVDRNTGDDLLTAPANVVRFYQDGGNIYRFGFEIPDYASQIWSLSTLAVTWQAPQLIETGPLRLRVTVQGSVTVSGTTIDFTREYRLVAGQPYLQMMTTGTAPSGYTVMLAFPFATPIASLQHGTTAHWADDAPRTEFVSKKNEEPAGQASANQASAFPLMTVEATHEYVLPIDASGKPIAGMYHASTPGWGIDNTDGATLLGCILRNTPATSGPGGSCNAENGSDSNAATAVYALRVPSGLSGPTTGQPLCEALEFIMPPVAYQAAATPTANPPLPASMPIAEADEDSPAIVTSVKSVSVTTGSIKPGSLIIRTYQPTNAAASSFTVTVADMLAQRFQSNGQLNVVPCTALEAQTSTDTLPATTDTFTVNASRAINTVALTAGS